MDAVYMDATTSMTGHGGWPMTCVLDHDGNPFFAGTYFPDQPRHGQPSFRQVLEALTDAWQTKPEDVQRVAGNLREHLGRATAMAAGAITEETLGAGGHAAGARLRRRQRRLRRRRRSSRRRWCSSSCADAERRPMRRGHPRGDGPRRHLRPARRRLRALLGRRGLGGAALREDALRQRPAARALRTGRRSARRPGRPRDRRLHARASWARPRAASPPRSTPTARGSRASSTPGPPQELVEVLGPDDGGLGGRRLRGDRRRHLRARQLHPAAAWSTPTTSRRSRGSTTSADDCSRRVRQRVRPARDDKVVAAWNGLAHHRPLRRRAAARRPGVRRRGGRRRRAAVAGARRRRPAAAGLARRRRGRASGRAGGLRLRRVRLPVARAGDRRRGLARPRPDRCSTQRSSASAPTTAASSTPPPTPRPWSPGRATPATTPSRPVCPR